MAHEHEDFAGPAFTRAFSTIERTRHRGHSVYIKRFVKRSDAGEPRGSATHHRCQREIDIIGRLGDISGLGSRLGRMTLVEGRPEEGILVTREIPGRPLSDVLMSAHSDIACKTVMFLAGKWIRLFQGLSPKAVDSVRLGSSSPINLVSYCDIRLERLQREGYRWMTTDRRRRVLEAVAHLCATSSEEDELAWSHGDYGPNNMLWDGRVLTPIDFAMANLDRPLKDVTYFIHRLEMMRAYLPFRRWPVVEWKRAFLRGYRRPDAEQSSVYRALRIRHLVCRMNTYVSRTPRNTSQRLHDAWVRGRVRALLMAEVADALDL